MDMNQRTAVAAWKSAHHAQWWLLFVRKHTRPAACQFESQRQTSF
jgi:hypothetical protein